MKDKWFIFILLFVNQLLACEIVDLTSDSQAAARSSFISDSDNAGVRVAFGGMKSANKQFGLGTVNQAITGYERRLCQSLRSTTDQVRITKTDFKGYYVECSPMPACASRIDRIVGEVRPPEFRGGSTLAVNHAESANYREGYIRARALEAYPNFSGSLPEFVESELRESYAIANRDPELRARLASQVDLYRAQGLSAVDPNYRRLIVALDTLLEVPFAQSSNIDQSLGQILTTTQTNSGLTIETAKTGDDYFAIIKSDQRVERVIGLDAKGLGTLNITKRFEMLENQLQGQSRITSVDDIFDLSRRATEGADQAMAASFNQFDRNLNFAMENHSTMTIDERIRQAHQLYSSERGRDPSLMQMRSAVLSDCAHSNSGQIMDRITVIHNGLKKLEEAGINEFYPTSCMGINYLLIKHGL